MDNWGIGLLAAGLGLGLAALILQTWRAGKTRQVLRARYLAACGALLTDARLTTGAVGFPRLCGRYQGQIFDVQAVPDTLTFRKLPALWILVTLPAPLPLRATLDLMIRPTGVEPFSNFHRLAEQIAVPTGFPEDCAIRTDLAEALPPDALLRPHLAMFDDLRVKELVLSPKGLRLVFLAEEANRGRYLIFRDAEMGLLPLAPERLETHLRSLLALHSDILAQERPVRNRRSA